MREEDICCRTDGVEVERERLTVGRRDGEERDTVGARLADVLGLGALRLERGEYEGVERLGCGLLRTALDRDELLDETERLGAEDAVARWREGVCTFELDPELERTEGERLRFWAEARYSVRLDAMNNAATRKMSMRFRRVGTLGVVFISA